MYSYKIKIANKNIVFLSSLSMPPRQFYPYLSDEESIDCVIDSSLSSLKHEELDEETLRVLTNKSDTFVEYTLALHKLANAMLQYDTFLMHGAVVAVGNSAYMFTAKSGTGKTTHIRKWLENLPDAFVVNGDKPLIIASKEQPQACGTPWYGKERMGTNIIVPLKAIVFMERAEENTIRPISFTEAFPHLLEQTHRPQDVELLRKTLSLLTSLNGEVSFYHFAFNNLASNAFEVSYRALTNQSLSSE